MRVKKLCSCCFKSLCFYDRRALQTNGFSNIVHVLLPRKSIQLQFDIQLHLGVNLAGISHHGSVKMVRGFPTIAESSIVRLDGNCLLSQSWMDNLDYITVNTNTLKFFFLLSSHFFVETNCISTHISSNNLCIKFSVSSCNNTQSHIRYHHYFHTITTL